MVYGIQARTCTHGHARTNTVRFVDVGHSTTALFCPGRHMLRARPQQCAASSRTTIPTHLPMFFNQHGMHAPTAVKRGLGHGMHKSRAVASSGAGPRTGNCMKAHPPVHEHHHLVISACVRRVTDNQCPPDTIHILHRVMGVIPVTWRSTGSTGPGASGTVQRSEAVQQHTAVRQCEQNAGRAMRFMSIAGLFSKCEWHDGMALGTMARQR